MERLQEAIKRARRERQGNIGTADQALGERMGPSHPGNSITSNPTSSERFMVLGPPPAFIEYTETRQIELKDQHTEMRRVIATRPGDARMEVYRQLRTQILQTLQRNSWTTLAITSPMKDAGKTLTAVNLAMSLARESSHTVLLVDLDLVQPSLHTTLGVNAKWGIADVLEGRVELREALINPGIQRLVVLPGRPQESMASELLSSQSMRRLMEDITRRYESRYIIFDLPPLLRDDNALKFAPLVDATLIVVEAGVNTPEEVERSMHLIANTNLLGTILNKARE